MAFLGKWEAVSYGNIQEGMKATGIPDSILNAIIGSKLILEFAQKGDNYYKTDSVSLVMNENEFKPGEQFVCKNWLGQTQNWTIDVDDDKVIEKRKVDNNMITSTYEVKNDQLIARCQQVGMAPCVVRFQKST